MEDYGLSEFIKKSFQMQQDIAQQWAKAMFGSMSQPAPAANLTEGVEGAMKAFQDMYANWQKQFMDSPLMKFQPWSYNLFNTGNTLTDIFSKTMNGGKILSDLAEFWQKLAAQAPFANKEEIEKFIASQASYGKMAQDMIAPFVPEAMRPLFNDMQALVSQYGDIASTFSKPWADMAQNKEMLEAFAKGDKGAGSAFFKALTEAYENSYGKIFNAFGFGLTREQDEAVLTNFDAFYKMILAMAELMNLVAEVSKQNMVAVVEAYQKLVAEGKAPQSLREFYKLWVKINEDAFEACFATPEFSKIFCNFAEKACSFKVHLDKVLEQTFDWLPFPKNSQMVSLYKTVYQLRKSDYFNTKEIAALKEEVAALRALVDSKLGKGTK